jgi:hypothetical protein
MRIAMVILFLFSAEARANPIALALPASDRIYLASEHLTATVSPDVAELQGTFTFQYRQDVPAPGRPSFVMLEIPIWFPEADPEDPAVAAFWKAFPKDEVTEVTPQMRTTFEQAIALRVGLGNKSLRVEQFSTLTSTNSRQRWAPREWQQEVGFCCLVFRFYFKDDSALTKKPLTISYRQPLVHADRGGRFFYLPVFQNLPKGASTADTNRYAITIAAHQGCSLVVTSGDRTFAVKAGHSIALSPRHYQPIRALAKTRPNKSVETNRRPVTPLHAGRQSGSALRAPPSLSAAVAHLCCWAETCGPVRRWCN